LNSNSVNSIIKAFAFATFLFFNVFQFAYAAENEVFLSLSSSGGKSRIGLADFIPVNASMEEMVCQETLKPFWKMI